MSWYIISIVLAKYEHSSFLVGGEGGGGGWDGGDTKFVERYLTSGPLPPPPKRGWRVTDSRKGVKGRRKERERGREERRRFMLSAYADRNAYEHTRGR